MNMLYLTYFLNAFLMILAPILLGIYLSRKFKLGARLWWIGAATFVLSQVGHIPFNMGLTVVFANGWLPSPPESWQLIFNALVLGLSAGLWEEIFRYLAYRGWAKDARSWGRGLMLGAGHGGIEAILLGILVMVTYIGMAIARGFDLEALVSPDQLGLAQQQINAYWSAPWYATILGFLERVFAMTFHLSASVLVLQVFVRKQIRWLWIAIGWHALFDAVAVFAVATWGPYITEGLLAVFSSASLGIIFALRRPEPPEEAMATFIDPALKPAPDLLDIDELPEMLDRTRYQ